MLQVSDRGKTGFVCVQQLTLTVLHKPGLMGEQQPSEFLLHVHNSFLDVARWTKLTCESSQWLALEEFTR